MCATPVECENIGFDSIFQVVGAVDADNIPYTPWSRA